MGWDNEVWEPLLVQMLKDFITRVVQKDPAHGNWCMNGHKVTVWADTGSLVTGVIVESGGSLVEDACLLYMNISILTWQSSTQC